MKLLFFQTALNLKTSALITRLILSSFTLLKYLIAASSLIQESSHLNMVTSKTLLQVQVIVPLVIISIKINFGMAKVFKLSKVVMTEFTILLSSQLKMAKYFLVVLQPYVLKVATLYK